MTGVNIFFFLFGVFFLFYFDCLYADVMCLCIGFVGRVYFACYKHWTWKKKHKTETEKANVNIVRTTSTCGSNNKLHQFVSNKNIPKNLHKKQSICSYHCLKQAIFFVPHFVILFSNGTSYPLDKVKLS